MTNKYNNVYINFYSSVGGVYEKNGKLGKYFDKCYDDFYMGEDSFEKGEFVLLKNSLDILMKKSKIKKNNIELFISSDLNNQIVNSSKGANYLGCPYIGCYEACSSNCLGLIIGSNFISNGSVSNCIVSVSSHNLTSERQFRNPSEYGCPKVGSSTFTSTGACSCLLSNKKGDIRISSSTLGRVFDFNINDVNHMGAVMAGACANSIYEHLKNTNTKVSDYDLILSGDLGIYGKKILIDYMMSEYNIDISDNYDDCGSMIYDLKRQKDVKAGGSGPVCSSLVINSYILPKIKDKSLKKVLYVATGALFNPVSVFQNENILSVAHCVCLESV